MTNTIDIEPTAEDVAEYFQTVDAALCRLVQLTDHIAATRKELNDIAPTIDAFATFVNAMTAHRADLTSIVDAMLNAHVGLLLAAEPMS